MFSCQDITEMVAPFGLMPMGVVLASTDDPVPNDTRSIVLLGPSGPDFWVRLLASGEQQDGQSDPLDRWSHRVINDIATQLGGHPVFPFGEDPPAPFIGWALRSGQAFLSKVNLLIHEQAGLWVSYRGAVALPFDLDLPPAGNNPCDTCVTKPCLNACPVGALTPQGYDIPACHTYLDTQAGRDCMDQGCNVRRVCPISQSFGRTADQSAHHMRYFHR